jgi:hypothetical protein
VLPEIKFVIQVVDQHNRGRLAFRFVRSNHRAESAGKRLRRYDYDFATGLCAMPVRGMVLPSSDC